LAHNLSLSRGPILDHVSFLGVLFIFRLDLFTGSRRPSQPLRTIGQLSRHGGHDQDGNPGIFGIYKDLAIREDQEI
jgi:hypothetical protein